MVTYLKRSMREPRKLRKLLCRLMWLSSSSLILPKTCRREKKGSVTQARAQQLGNRLQAHLRCRDRSCPRPIALSAASPKSSRHPPSLHNPSWKSTPANTRRCKASAPWSRHRAAVREGDSPLLGRDLWWAAKAARGRAAMETGARRTWDQPTPTSPRPSLCRAMGGIRAPPGSWRSQARWRHRDKPQHPGWVLGSRSWKLPGAFPSVGKRSTMLRLGTAVQIGWGRAWRREGQTDCWPTMDSQTPGTTVPRAKRGNNVPNTDDILITTHS